jgi:predicted RNA binding protein YcfA (HicA-like mRNA interferase family)
MSDRLPVISGEEAIAAFARAGYAVVRQRGSHVRLRDPSQPTRPPLSIPQHDELRPGLLRRLLRDAGLTVEEFRDLLR